MGQSITFLFAANFIPAKHTYTTFILPLGFILFRLFDILKPSIIGKIDKKVKNAWGVMLDDIAAGIFASTSLLIFIFIASIISNYFIKI